MRTPLTRSRRWSLLAAVAAAAAIAVPVALSSSHREAPNIMLDPAADNTDVYAFVSPDDPDTVTMITNYVPLEGPAGGPNFYEFGDDVLYEINVDNNGDGVADVTYRFTFTTELRDPDALARRFYGFCPDIVDQGTGSVASLAAEMRRERTLYCWWD